MNNGLSYPEAKKFLRQSLIKNRPAKNTSHNKRTTNQDHNITKESVQLDSIYGDDEADRFSYN